MSVLKEIATSHNNSLLLNNHAIGLKTMSRPWIVYELIWSDFQVPIF
jgi:hypothetical protein